jgi:hypothetical protein
VKVLTKGLLGSCSWCNDREGAVTVCGSVSVYFYIVRDEVRRVGGRRGCGVGSACKGNVSIERDGM